MATNFCWFYPQNRIPVTYGRRRWRTVCALHGCRRRLVAQPGGLTPGFASHLVFHCVQTSPSCRRHRRTACCTTTRRSASYVSCERDTARMNSLRPALKRRCRWARGTSVDRFLLPAGPTAANPPLRCVAAECWDKRTDSFTAPAAHATRPPSLGI